MNCNLINFSHYLISSTIKIYQFYSIYNSSLLFLNFCFYFIVYSTFFTFAFIFLSLFHFIRRLIFFSSILHQFILIALLYRLRGIVCAIRNMLAEDRFINAQIFRWRRRRRRRRRRGKAQSGWQHGALSVVA